MKNAPLTLIPLALVVLSLPALAIEPGDRLLVPTAMGASQETNSLLGAAVSQVTIAAAAVDQEPTVLAAEAGDRVLIPTAMQAHQPEDALELSKKVEDDIERAPGMLLNIVEDYMLQFPQYACEIVSTAIVSVEGSAEIVSEIVAAAVSAYPTQAPVIQACAIRNAPYAEAEIRGAITRILGNDPSAITTGGKNGFKSSPKGPKTLIPTPQEAGPETPAPTPLGFGPFFPLFPGGFGNGFEFEQPNPNTQTPVNPQ
ncbi:MAG: hypothetical protein AAF555_01605 [Verrucomicrobiota bacterium]